MRPKAYAVVMRIGTISCIGNCKNKMKNANAYFSLQLLIRAWMNLHLLRTTVCRSLQRSNVPVSFLFTKFVADSKPPSRDNDRKAFYLRMQQHNEVRVAPTSYDQGSCKNDVFTL